MVHPSWNCVGASVVGSSHLRRDLPCQDAHAWQLLPNGYLLMVVADGAGSAPRSEEGARCAVNSVLECLSHQLATDQLHEPEPPENFLQSAFEQARASLEKQANGGALRDFATTLLIAIVGNRWTSFAQVGDGGAVIRYRSGSLRVLSAPGHGEYLNETTFLTSSDYLDQAHYASLPSEEIDGLALFSDGVQFLALHYSDNTAHPPFFEPLFEFARQGSPDVAELQHFLSSERVCEHTDDDKTLLLAVRC